MARLRTAVLELSVTVSTHPYWDTLEPGTVVDGRMTLKQTATTAVGAVPAAARAA